LNIKQNIAIIIILIFFSSLYSKQQLDGIAAVVGDSVILFSELDAYILYKNSDLKEAPDSITLQNLRKKNLEDLIDGKVLVVHAAKDSLIEIKETEIEQAVNNQINQILRQNSITLDILEKELQEKYKMNISKFKAQLRTQIREQIIKQKVMQQYIGQVNINKNDVEEFYKEFKDSLPSFGESVLLYKLVRTILPSDSLRQQAYNKIKKIKTILDRGEDFGTVAKKYSEDPNSENGGDLGFIQKGTLNELKFENIAFSLNVGEISDIFETRLGFHIIQVTDKKEQMVHVRQILVKLIPPEEVINKEMQRLDSIKANIKTKEDFIGAVKKFSTDSKSKAQNGRIGWYPLFGLSEELKDMLDSLPIGGITSPIRENNDIVIYRLDERQQNRKLTLEDDYDLLAEKTKEIMMQKKLIELVKKWRKEIYVEIRL